MVDTATSYSSAVLLENRQLDLAAKAFEANWTNIHGPPALVSADLEFLGDTFVDSLKYHGIKHEKRPARRQNKIGIVENKKPCCPTTSPEDAGRCQVLQGEWEILL